MLDRDRARLSRRPRPVRNTGFISVAVCVTFYSSAIGAKEGQLMGFGGNLTEIVFSVHSDQRPVKLRAGIAATDDTLNVLIGVRYPAPRQLVQFILFTGEGTGFMRVNGRDGGVPHTIKNGECEKKKRKHRGGQCGYFGVACFRVAQKN